MKVTKHFSESLQNLLASKLRSFLAVLGVLVGTASVVAMVSCGQLATRQALKQFEALGTDLLSVTLYAEEDKGRQLQKQTLTAQQLMNLSRLSPEINAVSPYSLSYSPVSYHGQELHADIIGVTGNLQHTIKISMAQGRFISDLDNDAYYCVIGNHLFQQLQQIALVNPMGKQIWIGKTIFTIIGVAKPWPENSFFNENINDAILIPINSVSLLSNFSNINNLIMTLNKEASIDKLQTTLRHTLSNQVPGLNVFFRSPKQLLDSMAAQSRIFTLMLGLIGAIGLFVGGIGIMNIMLVSVTERRKEIGIRMAIGARRTDIQLLFLTESIILSLIGGIIGVFVGFLTAYLIASFSHWEFVFLLTPALVGFLISVMVGVFFGFYPAYKASRLDPIQTLRSE